MITETFVAIAERDKRAGKRHFVKKDKVSMAFRDRRLLLEGVRSELIIQMILAQELIALKRSGKWKPDALMTEILKAFIVGANKALQFRGKED